MHESALAAIDDKLKQRRTWLETRQDRLKDALRELDQINAGVKDMNDEIADLERARAKLAGDVDVLAKVGIMTASVVDDAERAV